MSGGNGSIKLFKVFGIRVGVDVSWFVILFLAIFWLSGVFKSVLSGDGTVAYLAAVATALLFFGSLLAHEFGHAIAARRAGIGVPRAIEGPQPAINAVALTGDSPVNPVFLVLTFLATMNAVILAFNLLPAWPLDGGRVARAVAWKLTGSRLRGTLISANLGKGLALLLGGLGLWQVLAGDLGGLWWILLAFFIGSAARQAVAQTQVTESLAGRNVIDVMDRHPVTLPASVDVVRADEEWFRRYGWSWFPVVDESGRFLGIAREQEVRPASERPGLGSPPLISEMIDPGSGQEWRVAETEPLESLLGSEALARHGALMAVDESGVLRGVITVEQVRAALKPSAM